MRIMKIKNQLVSLSFVFCSSSSAFFHSFKQQEERERERGGHYFSRCPYLEAKDAGGGGRPWWNLVCAVYVASCRYNQRIHCRGKDYSYTEDGSDLRL